MCSVSSYIVRFLAQWFTHAVFLKDSSLNKGNRKRGFMPKCINPACWNPQHCLNRVGQWEIKASFTKVCCAHSVIGLCHTSHHTRPASLMQSTHYYKIVHNIRTCSIRLGLD
jgi:hypothetical protein